MAEWKKGRNVARKIQWGSLSRREVYTAGMLMAIRTLPKAADGMPNLPPNGKRRPTTARY